MSNLFYPISLAVLLICFSIWMMRLDERPRKPGPGEPCPVCGHRQPMTGAQRQRRYVERKAK